MIEDVVIVGGGPNGLLMASELALAGVRAVVLEQRTEPTTLPRANGLVGQVVQALDYRGIASDFSDSTERPEPVPYFQYGGLVLDMSRLEHHSLYALPIPQRRMEELLEDRARRLGVDLRQGHELTGLSQTDQLVTLKVHGPNRAYELDAHYVVAADGGRSTIRKTLGVDFRGHTDTRFVSRSGEVAVAAPAAVPGTGELVLPDGTTLRPAIFNRTEHGLFAYLMVRPGVYRLGVSEWSDVPGEENENTPVEEISAAVARVLGAELPISEAPDAVGPGRTMSGINSRIADRYRAGRVFLVGDAAHVHSGFGGPGLNLGMQDVLNLGWKLAAAIRGTAPDDLLDTYETERRPLGERVLMQSQAQIELLSPGPTVTALRHLFEELLRGPQAVQQMSDLLSGADACYDMNPLGPAHRLTGRWMPDLAIMIDGRSIRVAELMRSGRPVLLDFAGRTELFESAEAWKDRVDVINATTAEPPADAVLVRPDAYVAWATDSDASDSIEGLRHALQTWFGSSVVA